MNAIIALTRGYRDIRRYDEIIKRNKSINKFFGGKYPVILFHEGDITEDHQKHIQSATPEMPITFTDISANWSGGYEGMCRFQTYDLWEYCKDFDYIMRIDEDCWLEEMVVDPFEQIGENVYLKTCYFAESHSETNATLPQFIEELTGAKREDFYNDKFVYTNVSVSSVKFWREEKMNAILKQIAYSDLQRQNRWGDLPVLGSLLNIYAKDRVGTTYGLTYYHHSHNITIESHD